MAIGMAAVTFVASWPPDIVQAGMISTKTIIESKSPSQEKPAKTLERIRILLARGDVRAQMVALGVDPAEAEARINALTDEELPLRAGRLAELPAGAGAMTTFALVALIVTVVALVASRFSSGGGRLCSYRPVRCWYRLLMSVKAHTRSVSGSTKPESLTALLLTAK